MRISEETKNELEEFAHHEKLEQTSEAARKLLALGLEEWHKKRALQLLAAGKVTLSKGAEIAKMDVWEFLELVKQQGISWMKEKRFIEKDLSTKIAR